MSQKYAHCCIFAAAVAFLILIQVPDSSAGDAWTGFRNNGASLTPSKSLPVEWSPTSGITWQAELPGYGQSSPLLWEDRIYVTAVKGPQKEESLVVAVSASTGEVIWEKSIETTSQAANYYAKSRAAPTPVVDRSGVYAFFEGGDVIGVSHDGELLWQRSLTEEYGEFQNGHGLGSSLAQTEDSVIVLIDHSGPSYLLSLDKETGTNRWKVDRESRSSWASPVVASIHGKPQIVISSNGTVDGYDPVDGKQLWTVGDVGGNTIPSVTVVDDRVYAGASVSEFGDGSVSQSTCCIEVGKDNTAEIAWRAEKANCHYVSPLVSDGRVYTVNKVGVVHCLDAESGEKIYAKRAGGMCWSTPIASEGSIYLFAKDGLTTVVKPGSEFEVIAECELWDRDDPPQPETYVEHRPERSGSRQSFTERMKEADKDGDGLVKKEELPESMRGFFARLDSNSDGSIDSEEIEAMAERARQRSSSSSESYGDPIVYGVAATEGAFFIRTGTRIYCVGSLQ
ncbi:MAG: PQQ-binding-like beta-propeller repeat protein [Planctomycetota bacterium]